jgi:hypothetical protein
VSRCIARQDSQPISRVHIRALIQLADFSLDAAITYIVESTASGGGYESIWKRHLQPTRPPRTIARWSHWWMAVTAGAFAPSQAPPFSPSLSTRPAHTIGSELN